MYTYVPYGMQINTAHCVLAKLYCALYMVNYASCNVAQSTYGDTTIITLNIPIYIHTYWEGIFSVLMHL